MSRLWLAADTGWILQESGVRGLIVGHNLCMVTFLILIGSIGFAAIIGLFVLVAVVWMNPVFAVLFVLAFLLLGVAPYLGKSEKGTTPAAMMKRERTSLDEDPPFGKP